MQNDTIAAVATPPGEGGISIIRISGPKAEAVLRRVFSHKGEYAHAKMYYGKVVRDKETLDSGMAVLFRAPNSFTGEDSAELHLHGSVPGTARVLEFVTQKDARPAQAGEFTRRAFLNGKIDLTQAEAVGDYISAQSRAGAAASARQMEGNLLREMQDCQNALKDILAETEAAVEYPEEDLEPQLANDALPKLLQLEKRISQAAQSYSRGRVIKEGLRVAIAGKPNAGKSSLLNALAGRDRVIVSDTPGTTRDTVEQAVAIGDIAVYFEDTAGIRSTEDKIEAEGVKRSQNAIKNADIVIFVLDGSVAPGLEDSRIRQEIEGAQRPFIAVINKADIAQKNAAEQLREIADEKPLMVSAKNGDGIGALKQEIYNRAMGDAAPQSVLITNERHRYLLLQAAGQIADAAAELERGMDMDCVTIDLNAAYKTLGEITGSTVSEDIIDRIFEKFCLGK